MKKLKNQTGLVKPDKLPVGATAHKASKPKAAKPAKVGKKAAKQSKPKAKASGGKKPLPKGFKEKQFKPKSFSELTGGKVRATDYTTEELAQMNRKLASVANKRLAALEKSGFTKGAYKAAKAGLATQGREKFTGASKGKSRDFLVNEFIRMRGFLSAQTSTAAGVQAWKDNVYQALIRAGFSGTPEELSALFNKYFTKQLESALGSDVAFEMIQSEDGRQTLQEMQDALKRGVEQGKGAKEALADFLGVPIDKIAGAALVRSLGFKYEGISRNDDSGKQSRVSWDGQETLSGKRRQI